MGTFISQIMIRRALTLLTFTVLLYGGGLEAQGRPLRLNIRTELTFGTLLPGVTAVVPPTDPLNAGQIDLRGQRNADVLVEFVLPADLVGPGGASLPLLFGPGAAGYSPQADIGTQIGFDPVVPQVFTLPSNGNAAVFLGGTASPPANIPPGDYSNTVTLQVAYVNN